MSAQFKRASLGEQVADALRDQILVGEIAPSASLHEVSVAEAFGVSRNTIREALRMLEGEGLVEYIPHKGVVATRITADEIDDLYIARMAIEVFAIEQASQPSDAQEKALAQALDRLVNASGNGTPQNLVKADLAFHQTIVSLGDNAHLSHFHAGLCAQIQRALVVISQVQQETSSPGPLVEEHKEILDALLNHERRPTAGELLRDHISKHRAIAIELFMHTMG